MIYSVIVNGTKHDIDVDGGTPLLWVLRDILDLKGSKFSCGVGQCGACTVHIDGQIAKSCVTPVSRVGSRAVTTIEAIGESPLGKKVQDAWIEVDVAQCGYCQGGQIMAATALLSKEPHPTDADIDAHMSGNLCRCATYNRIRTAIKLVAAGDSKPKEG